MPSRTRLLLAGATAAGVVAAASATAAGEPTTLSDQPYSMFDTPPARGSLLSRADQ